MTQLGKYTILEELGRGGFAVVYKARDPELDRVIALKVLHPYWTADPGFATRFRHEARSAANLRHANIVTIYEAGEADGQLYIAMAYLPGCTLHQLLEAEGALSLEQTLPILEGLAEALDYAHGRGVVHRDIKPGNVIVEETAHGVHATLMDFGLVKAMTGSTALTSLGTLLGSPEYMAPEQADPEQAAEVGPAADRYALGIVAYQMLTGRVPFPGNTPATLYAHEHKPVPRPCSLRPDLPQPAAAALLRMLAKVAGDRYPTAAAFVAELRRVLRSEKAHRQPLPIWAWIAGAGLLAVALILFVLVLTGGGNGDAKLTAAPTAAAAVVRPSTDTPKAVVPPTPQPTDTSTSTDAETPAATPESTDAETPAATPDLTPAGTTRTRPRDGAEMVYVPGDVFRMGSVDGDDDEQPVHTVTLNSFWIDRCEVANAQFAAFLNEQGNQTEGGATWMDLNAEDSLIEQVSGEYRPKSDYESHPVIDVSWYGAAAYCEWAGARLPTEAEWEYAARGPQENIYPWGNDDPDCDKANYWGKQSGCVGETSHVGSFPDGASWCEAVDMAGNVWEWVNDWYDGYPGTTYQGDGFGTKYKVLRGGSWTDYAGDVRSATRYGFIPDYSFNYVGFRCAAASTP